MTVLKRKRTDLILKTRYRSESDLVSGTPEEIWSYSFRIISDVGK